MISPLVRRRRLGTELLKLRKESKIPTVNICKKSGLNTARLSRIENASFAPNLADVMALLEVYGVAGEEWHRIIKIANDGAEQGWWRAFGKHMGARQRVAADLESGANTIQDYAGGYIPGLLQTADYIRARWEISNLRGDLASNAKIGKNIEARLARQKMLRRPDGPAYTAVIDELALRRHAAPATVMQGQILELARLQDEDDQITLRVLPINADIANYWIPTANISLYTYPDPDDPTMALLEGETNDQLLCDDETEPYIQLFTRLHEAALSHSDSTQLFRSIANQL